MYYKINTCKIFNHFLYELCNEYVLIQKKFILHFVCSSWPSSSKSRYKVKSGFGNVKHGGESHSQGEHQVYSQGLCSSVDSSGLLSTRTIKIFLGTPSSRRATKPCNDADTFKLTCLPFHHVGSMKVHQRSICTFG